MPRISKAITTWFITLVISALFVGSSSAATQPFGLRCRTKIIRDGVVNYENRSYDYNFLVQVISDNEGYKSEALRYGKPFITAQPQERYTIILHNPLPVRVAVNLTIDGINSISGQPCRPNEGSKWIIEPYSFVSIRGWQVNGQDSRRFYFTSKDDSYASWRSNSWGRDLSVNCGVIGAAYFWSKTDLENYFEQNPVYEYTRRPGPFNNLFGLRKDATGGASSPACQEGSLDKKEKAGTGMGERETNPVEMVQFRYDTGMYKPHQAVIIYYDFAQAPPVPQPFLGMNFAPEIPD